MGRIPQYTLKLEEEISARQIMEEEIKKRKEEAIKAETYTLSERLLAKLSGETITANGHVYICPNTAGYLTDWMKGTRESYRQTADINGLEDIPDKDLKMTQIVIVSDDKHIREGRTLGSDNVAEGYLTLKKIDNGRVYSINYRTSQMRFIPSKLLEGVNEGDTVVIKFNARILQIYDITGKKQKKFDWNTHPNVKIYDTIEMSLMANQKDYPFSQYGSFQKVFKDMN